MNDRVNLHRLTFSCDTMSVVDGELLIQLDSHFLDASLWWRKLNSKANLKQN